MNLCALSGYQTVMNTLKSAVLCHAIVLSFPLTALMIQSLWKCATVIVVCLMNVCAPTFPARY